jgi:large conductance mechanosensitive channel
MKSFFNEFKKFITRGNVFELAIAVVIGGAFSRIVQSLVNDIIMPLLSLLIGSVPFANLKLVLVAANDINNISEIAIYYGRFIQVSIDFLMIATVIFLVFKGLQKAFQAANKFGLDTNFEKSKKETTESILKDIRKLLENKK